jgi:hypothetical protein
LEQAKGIKDEGKRRSALNEIMFSLLKILSAREDNEGEYDDLVTQFSAEIGDAYGIDKDDILREREAKTPKRVVGGTETTTTEKVNDTRDDFNDRFLLAALAKRGISEELRLSVAAELTGSKSLKPQWVDKDKSDELKNLTAPQFLKRVHSDIIKKNKVYKADVRARDPDLMNAVEAYISQRKRRGADLGDATGLILIASRPARNLVPRSVSFKRKFGKKAKKMIEAVREADRTTSEARRHRRRTPTP